jgi:sugar phosphate isomerase/epimerase
MSTQPTNTHPKLHNAMWPGLVGKGSPGAEPCIDLDTMLDLTARAEVNGVRFDGVDLFLFDPHVSIDLDEDGIKRLADKVQARGFVIGSVVAPVWGPTGGGSAMGAEPDRRQFVEQVRKACRIASKLRELGVRPYGVVRIDSACGVADWVQEPTGNQDRIARTFSEACDVAEQFGERLAAEGEICWGGMHSWRKMLALLEQVNRPNTLGFQADMAHTLLYILGYNAPEDAILPSNWDWSDPARLDAALKTLTDSLRPWTIDFHVAQNDGTVKGSGTHDKTGHHCLPQDPNGKLTIARHAGYWLRDSQGQPTRAFRHICWDGCMFPNAVMRDVQTWNQILQVMIDARNAHGWSEAAGSAPEKPAILEVRSRATAVRKRKKPAARAKPKPLSPGRAAKAKPARRQAPRKASRKNKASRKSAPSRATPAQRRPPRKARRK